MNSEISDNLFNKNHISDATDVRKAQLLVDIRKTRQLDHDIIESSRQVIAPQQPIKSEITLVDDDKLHVLIHKPKPPTRRSSSVIKHHPDLDNIEPLISLNTHILSFNNIKSNDQTLEKDKLERNSIERTSQHEGLLKQISSHNKHLGSVITTDKLNKAAAAASAISVAENTRNAFGHHLQSSASSLTIVTLNELHNQSSSSEYHQDNDSNINNSPMASSTPTTVASLLTPNHRLQLTRRKSKAFQATDNISSKTNDNIDAEMDSLNLIDEEEIANTISYLTASLRSSTHIMRSMSSCAPTTPTTNSTNNRERLALRTLSHDRRRTNVSRNLQETENALVNNENMNHGLSNEEKKEVVAVDPFYLIEPASKATATATKQVITRYGKARFSRKSSMADELVPSDNNAVLLETTTRTSSSTDHLHSNLQSQASEQSTLKKSLQTSTILSSDEFARKVNHLVEGYCYFPLELTQRDYFFRIYDLIGNGIRPTVLVIIKSSKFNTTTTSILPTISIESSSSNSIRTNGHTEAPHIPPPPPPPPITPSKEVLHISSDVASTIKKSSPSNMSVYTSTTRGTSNSILESPPLRHNSVTSPYPPLSGSHRKSFIASNQNTNPISPSNAVLLQHQSPGATTVVDEFYDSIRLLKVILLDNNFSQNIQNLAMTLVNIYEEELKTNLNATGYLGDYSSLFNCAKLLVSSISESSSTYYPSDGITSGSITSSVLIELNELQLQMNQHRKYKEDRMHALDWSWESDNIVKISPDRASLKPFESRTGSMSSTTESNSVISNNNNNIGLKRSSIRKTLQDQSVQMKHKINSISLESMPSFFTISDMNLLYDKMVRRSKGVKANLLFGLIPSNVAVIELMLCVTGIRDLLVQYKDYHKKQGHRAETIFLRSFIDALEQQLTVDLSSIGALKISAAREGSSDLNNTSASSVLLPTLAYDNNKANLTITASSFNDSFEIGSGFVNSLSSPNTTMGSSATLRRKSLDTSGTATDSVKDHMAFMLNQIFLDLDALSAKLALEQEQEQLSQTQKANHRSNSINKNRSDNDNNKRTNSMNMKNANQLKSLEETKEAISAKRRSWSSLTAGNDLGVSLADNQMISKLDMRASIRNGKYLLQRMHELVLSSEKIISDLQECCTVVLRMRSNIIQTDIENEAESDDLFKSLQQEEEIRGVIKELQDLKNQMNHKLAPLYLTHHEALNGMLSSVDFQNELASKLLSEPLATGTGLRREHVASSIASLLIRSKSVALVHSVFANWPNLIVDYHSCNNTSSSSTLVESTTTNTIPHLSVLENNGFENTNASIKTNAKDVDVLAVLNFDDIKSLRQIGFTLSQLRDSKCYDLKGLLAAGFPLHEVKCLKDGSDGMQILNTIITAKDLRLAGYSIKQCLTVGFDVSSLRAGGFSDYDLVKSNLFSIKELKQIGCDIQRIALLALFQATDGKHWRNKTNWGSPILPLSKWFGITVDGSGNVIKIDLRSNCLKGQLPTAIALLTSLKELDLYNNLLHGTIPEEYISLVNLRDVWLACTELTIDRPRLQVLLPHCKLRL